MQSGCNCAEGRLRRGVDGSLESRREENCREGLVGEESGSRAQQRPITRQKEFCLIKGPEHLHLATSKQEPLNRPEQGYQQPRFFSIHRLIGFCSASCAFLQSKLSLWFLPQRIDSSPPVHLPAAPASLAVAGGWPGSPGNPGEACRALPLPSCVACVKSINNRDVS